MKKQKNKISAAKVTFLIFSILVLCFAFVNLTIADWNTPTAAPPGNNAPAPLNVSGTGQTKTGPVTIGTGTLTDTALNLISTPSSPNYYSTLNVTGTINSSGGAILNTGGAPAGLIVAAGKVGIGVTSPDAKLAVIGDGTSVARIGGAGCGGNAVGISFWGAMSGCNNYTLLGIGNNLFINRPTGGNIYFRENNSDQLIIQATTGNVGIGTTSPVSLLSVGGTNQFQVNSSGNLIKINGVTYSWPSGTPADSTYLKYNTSGNALSWATVSGGGTSFANPSATIGLTTINGSATTAMRSDAAPALSVAIAPTWTGTHIFSNATYSALFTGGYVGIGTTTPSTNLDINGTIRIRGGSGTANQCLLSDATGLAHWGTCSGGSGNIVDPIYETLGATGGVESIAGDAGGRGITNLGNVGIGTTAPAEKLDVAGNINVSSTLNNESGSSFYINSYAKLQLRMNDCATPPCTGTANFQINNAANATVFAITDAGNVGIGTTNPSTKLYINGTGGTDSQIYQKSTDNSKTTILTLANSDGNRLLFGKQGSNNNGADGTVAYGAAFISNTDANPFYFMENTTGVTTLQAVAMTINSNRNVGIGTTTPMTSLGAYSSSLEVEGTTYAKGGLIIQSCTNGTNCPNNGGGTPATGQMWLINNP